MAKSPIDHLLKPVNRFIHREFTGGIVLFVSVVIAIVWANSSWSASYHKLWETPFAISFNGYGLDEPLHVWINDGLMALFFFVIGLELKREFMAGELSTAKKASLPMIAALGGMIVPALIYTVINLGDSDKVVTLQNPLPLRVYGNDSYECGECDGQARYYYPKVGEFRCPLHRDRSLQSKDDPPRKWETYLAYESDPMDAKHFVTDDDGF